MRRAICKIWIGTIVVLGVAGSARSSAAEEPWSYDAWKPGGERVTLDGITFDSTIHCGAGHNFVRVADGHYRFRSRIDHAPYAWRVYFKIECPEAVGRTITLEVADFDHAGRTPFHESATVYSLDGEHWATLGTENVAIVPWTPTGRADADKKYGDASHIPYGVQYRLKLARPVMWFASPTPYTLDRRDQLLDGLAKAHPDLVEVTTIGHSLHSKTQGYPIRMARITAPGDASRRQSVFVVAGEHCSETAGIYACEGWMSEVLEHADWLERFVFYFVPIVNVDGVYYGATYYNLAPRLADGIGENISTNWPRRTLPETQALWSVLERVRPVFFASLHNGRHRRTMEAYGPPGPATDALVDAWRAELGFAFEGVRSHGKSSRAWGVLDEAGITHRAYTIETLILCRQDGFDTFQASYTETGRQLARGTMTALGAPPSGDVKPAPPEPKPGVALRMAGDDFTAQLPWFYHALPFDKPQDHDVYSFEVNALGLPPGDYSVALVVRQVLPCALGGTGVSPVHQRKHGQDARATHKTMVEGPRVPKHVADELLVGFDGRTFEPVPVRDGRAELTGVPIRNRMLSLFIKARTADDGGPLASVLVYARDVPFAAASRAAEPFAEYRRQIRTEEREILDRDNWDEFYALLRREGFSKKRLRAMFDQIVDWCKRRQVLDPKDLHYGAIYSEEDKYDFRDAAAAAVCFTYAWRDSGDEEYRRRALLAREYVYKGQNMDDPADKERYGGFVQMVHGAWGPGMQRLGGPLTPITGVETCIIINLLIKTFELGLEPSPNDVARLQAAAAWVAASEFQPGVFRHHEGATHDCQNSNALGAMALARAYHALEELGQSPPHEWLKAARRGLTHFLEGQEAVGCWPYVFAKIGRGQAFREQNVPDQGMGVYHFLVACQTPAFRRLPGVENAAKRAARWWLAMSRIDRDGPSPTIDVDDRRAAGTLKFSKFTWCRFTAAASLMRIAELNDEKEPWRPLALAYLEHVGTKRWNTTDPDKAPIQRASPGGMTLCSWIQAAEWDAVLLREVEERMR